MAANSQGDLKERARNGRGQRIEAHIIREPNSKFASWFKEQISDKPLPTGMANANLIYALAVGPACNVSTYLSYDINGYTFYTEAKDKNYDYQNSGVTML